MMYYQEERSASRLFVGIAIVILVHAAIILGLKNGLATSVLPILPKSFETVFVELTQPKPVAPAPVQPEIVQPKVIEEIQMPMPEIELPSESPMVAAVPETSAPAEQTDAGVGESTAITQWQVDSRYPLTRPDYPAQSLRANEKGTVTLLLYVLPTGRVGEAQVSKSSGYPRLDQAAIREAKRNWRFIPSQRGGQAVAGWGTFAVTFQITN